MNEHELLAVIKTEYSAILSEKLTGIYIHGSIAFGCFSWERSDIDFLAVVKEPLTQYEKESLIKVLLKLGAEAPTKGFEMSVILESVCSPFVYPTPYELHFSNAYLERFKTDLAGQCRRLNGTDKDLAAHITVTRAVGIPLCGKAVDEVFSEVPRENYIDSLMYDIENALDDIADSPVYFTLNLCRVLAYLREGIVISKAQGGTWGAEHIPQYSTLINAALAAYSSSDEFSADNGELRNFAEYMLHEIRRATDGEDSVFSLNISE